jgi:hypothetical protein
MLGGSCRLIGGDSRGDDLAVMLIVCDGRLDSLQGKLIVGGYALKIAPDCL